MKKKSITILLAFVMALVFSVIPLPDSYATGGYGRTVASDKLTSGVDDGIVGAWMCIWDSSMEEPPWLDYFYADGTYEEVYWNSRYSQDPAYADTRDRASWEIAGETLIRHSRYDNEETFSDRTDRNGYTELTRHSSSRSERYVAISDEGYNILKNYKVSDWKNFDYTTLTKKTNKKASVAATSITKLSKGRKAFTVKWKKKKGVTGYQIQYGLKSNFKGARSVYVNKATTTSKKIKKLKARKKYYVRIRSYKVMKGRKYYSKWSAKKTVRIR